MTKKADLTWAVSLFLMLWIGGDGQTLNDILGWCKNGESLNSLEFNLTWNAQEIFEAYDGNGDTCLCNAAKKGHVKVVELLISANITRSHVDLSCGWRKRTALFYSIQYPEILDLLIGANADVNYQTWSGGTALMRATSYGYNHSVALLIKADANVNLQNYHNETALHYAAQNGNEKIVALLINANATINLQSDYGHTALHFAAWKGNEKIVALLIGANADVNLQNSYGYSALIEAARIENEHIVKSVLRACANTDIKDYFGKTALYYARYYGNLEIVKLLEEASMSNCSRETITLASMVTTVSTPTVSSQPSTETSTDYSKVAYKPPNMNITMATSKKTTQKQEKLLEPPNLQCHTNFNVTIDAGNWSSIAIAGYGQGRVQDGNGAMCFSQTPHGSLHFDVQDHCQGGQNPIKVECSVTKCVEK